MSDVIPVRPDEALDMNAFLEWAGDQKGLTAETPEILQFANGRANLTYLLKYEDGSELVLRRPPLGPVAPGSHDMSREYLVLSHLWQSFPLAPKAIAFCDDESVIGSQFFVMERLDGVVVKNEIPKLFGSGDDPDANRALSLVVIDTLADLHEVDPASCDLGNLGHPDGFLTRQVSGWAGRWQKAKHQPNPVADDIATWLADALPDSSSPSLIHNDWRLDNMAVDPTDPGKCVAVYDWDMATRGDPLADVGTLMATWYDPGEAPSALNPMPTAAPGWIRRSEALERYAAKTGRDLANVEWYVVFGTWKLAVVLQQIYIRWLKGQTRDERFESLGAGAERLFELAAERRS